MILDTVWNRYRIADFEIEPTSSSIRGPTGSKALPPKAIEVLGCLARNAREVVTKERVLDLVWGKGSGGEDVLANAVWQLRQALGDDARDPSLIGTVFRRGYRLLAEVSYLDPLGDPDRTVALVPLSSGGHHPEEHYFAATLTESLHHLLTQERGLRILRVAAREPLARTDDALDRIGWTLGAEHLVEGSVQATDSDVSLSLRHYRWSAGTVVWAETFAASPGRLQELEGRAAEELSAKLTARRSSSLVTVATPSDLLDPSTYSRFLRARHRVNQSDFEEIAQGISELEAVAKEVPDAAQVHEVIARGLFILAAWGHEPGRELLPRVVVQAEAALKSDLLSPDAPVWRILASRLQNWQVSAAAEDLARVVNDRPHRWTARDAYARCLAALGHFEEALEHSRLALASHPMFPPLEAALGMLLRMTGDCEGAVEQLEDALARHPSWRILPLELARTYRQLGRLEEAAELLLPIEPDWAELLTLLADGRASKARERLHRWDDNLEGAYVAPYWMAERCAWCGERDLALSWLERARDELQVQAIFTGVEPAFADLRTLPRFRSVVRDLGVSVDGRGRARP